MARYKYSWMVPSSETSQLSLDDSSEYSHSASRQPLTESHGNSQLYSLAPVGLYHDNKDYQQQTEGHTVDHFKLGSDIPCNECEPCLAGKYNCCEKGQLLSTPGLSKSGGYANPICPTPTVPSLPPNPYLAQTWGQRREMHRRRRQRRYQRNPIVESQHYQAYRARQVRDGSNKDAKWPHQLEMAFLDALLYIPYMGRRKFSYRGKPHGRNELIKEYLWISYLDSLSPGEVPDESMRRTRKQVSSHIQVLKTFFKDHPAYRQLFPDNKDPKNGFQDSFKNDPCLKALSEGRLPGKRYDDYDEITPHSSVMPALFWLLITSGPMPAGTDGGEQDLCRADIVFHKYTTLHNQRPRDSIESLINWRQRYPYFENIYTVMTLRSSLPCDVIQMDVSLSLMSMHPPKGSELVSRTEISIPGNNRNPDHNVWQIVTTLSKPQALCRDPAFDPPTEKNVSSLHVLSSSPQETRLKSPFPAMPWAQAFTALTDIALDPIFSSPETTRALLNEVSMFQEVQSTVGSGVPWVTRAIILWTFHQSRDGELGSTTWRYLDCQDLARRKCMSPHPGQTQRLNALMSQNFNSFIDNAHDLNHSQQQNILDPFIKHNNTGLVTPPATSGLNSPFGSQHPSFALEAYSQPHGQNGFDIPAENLSFASSTTTMDSESTLVGSERVNIDSLLSSNGVPGFDGSQLSHIVNTWKVTENFDHGQSWNYAHLPTNETPQLECWQDLGDDAGHSQGNMDIEEGHEWSGVTQGDVVERVKELEWIVEAPGNAEADSGWLDHQNHVGSDHDHDQGGGDGVGEGQEDNNNGGIEDWNDIHDTQQNDTMDVVGEVNNDGFEDVPVLKQEDSIGAGWESVEVDDFDYSRLDQLK